MLGMIKIMEAYLPLVKQIVDRIDVKLPQHWDKEDMIGYGMLGLMEAIKRFKPEKGVQFSTFASIRIKGAILDALRKDTPLPRTLWQKVRRITETMEQIYQVTGQEASIEVVAEKLGMGKSEVEEALEAYRLLSHISLEQSLGFSDSYEMTVADTLESKTWFSYLAIAYNNRIRSNVRPYQSTGLLHVSSNITFNLHLASPPTQLLLFLNPGKPH
jgi:RNA polymerase sigma factor (sigma-70 family)